MLKELKTRAIVTPLPVLIIGTYDAEGHPDAMNVAWGGQCGPKHIAINISSNHKTTENLRLNQAFTLQIADADRVELADYVGITSGHDPEKMERVHAVAKPGKEVNAPILEEFVLAMECKVVSMNDELGHTRVVGEVVRTVADDSVLTPDGTVDFSKLRPISFDSEMNEYRVVGESIAKAFSCGKALK